VLLTIAWGARAVELLEGQARSTGVAPEREGQLAIAGAAGAATADWRCWLSGRIVNAPELRARFGAPEAIDPAALVALAFARVGAKACESLRGTFVLVALDRESQEAMVVRDHLGGRPLVHARLGDGALLAEHERAIATLLPNTPSPDRLALTQWIDGGSIPADRTLFDEIRRIPPAHRVVLRAQSFTVEPYWRPRYQEPAAGSQQEIAECLRASAFAAVDRAAQDAQRPALLLSGGLDSSCVAAGLAARQAPAAAALALSGVFPTRPETDERELIEAAARQTRLPVELIAFDERASILAPALAHIDRWSLPPVTPNLFAWEPVMARARELGVDAMLDGEGGDELFAAAPHLIADMLRGGRALAAWRLTGRIPGLGVQADIRLRLRALRMFGAAPLLPPGLRRRRAHQRAAGEAQSLLAAADRAALIEHEHDLHAAGSLDGPMWWRGLADGLRQPGETLGVSAHLRREAIDERIDRRHPFLFDLDLLATVLCQPPAMQFEIRDRALLRDALAGHIPEAVRTRSEKSFFTGLLGAGLAADGALLAKGPTRTDAPVREFVRAEALDSLLHQGPAPAHAATARRLWHVGLADAWLRSLECPRYPQKLLEQTAARALQTSGL
jgi:asparagine synthase (glutamine-hydrolysing)